MSDTTLEFTRYEDFFSAATQPILQAPPFDDAVNPPGITTTTTKQQRTSSSEPSTSSASPLTSASSSSGGKSRRRVRPRIALAPNQPPTARGNDRIRVYVACHECRARKIRCDGAKPICFQCQKRPTESGPCTYDAAPNRKGHDRRRKGEPRSTQATGLKANKRMRKEAEDANPSPRTDETRSLSDSERHQYHSSSNEHSASDEPGDEDARNDAFHIELEDLWAYDPFAFDVDNVDHFQVPLSHSPSTSSSSHRHQGEDEHSIPSRPSVQFSRDTWWDALLAFYSTDGDSSLNVDIIALTSDHRNRAMRHIVSDLRALFQSAATWMSFVHLPRFFEQLLDPSRRARMQPSLLLSALALGTLAQSSEVERGKRGRDRALKLLDMAHGAMQSSLATGWVDVGLAQAAWMLLYFEVNTHPAQSWERTQSAMFLLDSLVRLFSLTTIDAGFQPTNGNALTSAGLGFASPIVINVNAPGAPPLPTAFAVQSLGITASIPIGAGISQAQQYGDGLPPYQQRWEPQPNPRAFDPPIQNPFYASGAAHSQPFISNMLQSGVGAPLTTADMESGSQGGPSTTHGHASRPQCGCNCAQFSLGKNWPSVNELAPTWAETIMWPTNLTDAEFSKEECRRLVWGSVMLIANLNAYASLTPGGIVQTGGLFVREYENFSLLTPSETVVCSGTPLQGDDVWSLSLRAMLLLHSCLRVRASTTMSGAQRAEFAVRAWLEIDDIERRLERHTCGLSSNYGFQSTEMLFSLRICVSYEFQRFIPQVTTTGSALFYRNKAEAWLQRLAGTADEAYKAFRAGEQGDPQLHHRKSLFIFWFMSGIKKCILLWEGDPTHLSALETASKSADQLEQLLLFWPSDRVRQMWQTIRYSLIEACKKAGVTPPSTTVPRPIMRRAPPATASAG